MNVTKIAHALREMADALDDRAKPLKRSVPRMKAVRRVATPLEHGEVDEVTQARARRILREHGFMKGSS